MKKNHEPWYVGWQNCHHEASDTLRQYYETPYFLPPDSDSKHDWIFMGTPGYGAPFHLDSVKYPSWQAQINGIKSWTLRPPPECFWACHGDVSVIMEPGCIQQRCSIIKPIHSSLLGDIIVVNTNKWFHATSVLEGLSITITNEYMQSQYSQMGNIFLSIIIESVNIHGCCHTNP